MQYVVRFHWLPLTKHLLSDLAVIEAAISSSLSHPNVVQTFTYSLSHMKGAAATATDSHSDGHSSACGTRLNDTNLWPSTGLGADAWQTEGQNVQATSSRATPSTDDAGRAIGGLHLSPIMSAEHVASQELSSSSTAGLEVSGREMYA